ncbi:hypothetical protein Gasu2_63950 [Galdieria sulphuraria]|uniref:Uncharacterized protein n=1 Tax=Galdieria sulphuraria TaxID=130081 RepID=M2XSS0_GALSU|nr:uncharacterized protein Gasu_59460 [Galdieria sulphuraria]EME26459.1 hypothetical protein Gasu_59460 [Galdieria sulphuraria]GJD12301.1 hypothetical protein Gasu2_63950 [Galdieria sulphuraria]|eukprot:XP_005702979.1 hypothetical protein Gasu_59460 [Galdieria sulphuraria]
MSHKQTQASLEFQEGEPLFENWPAPSSERSSFAKLHTFERVQSCVFVQKNHKPKKKRRAFGHLAVSGSLDNIVAN